MGFDKLRKPLLVPAEIIETVLRLLDGRVHDAIKTDLPDAAANDDLGLAEAIGSKMVTIETAGDGTATTTAYALWRFVLDPLSYDAGDPVTVRLRALTAVLGEVSDILDVEAKLVGEDGAVGADINGTAEKQLTAALADYDFVLAGATLTPGCEVQIRVKMARNDTGGTAAAVMSLSKVSVLHKAPHVDAQ